MSQIENTVFISYRRTSSSHGWALAIWQNLMQHDYDVFIDYRSLASGAFAQQILENIRTRAHVLILLTPSALKRVDQPGDWLRREMETALEHRRNIIPIMLEGFNFSSPSIGKRLTGTLEPLKAYQGIMVRADNFDSAMEQLRTRYLNVAVETVFHPPSALAKAAAAEQRIAAEAAPPVPRHELTAAQWFELGYASTDLAAQLYSYNEAIRLKPDFSEAYTNRGIAHHDRGELDAALADFEEAIRLTPDDPDAYSHRGNLRRITGDLPGALADFAEALRLNPVFPEAYNNRGNALGNDGDLAGALSDFDQAIRLKPDFADAYYNRGGAYRDSGNLDAALADLTEAIRLRPDDADAYNNRAIVFLYKKDFDAADADYTAAIRLKPGYAAAYRNRSNVRRLKGDLDGASRDRMEAVRLQPEWAALVESEDGPIS